MNRTALVLPLAAGLFLVANAALPQPPVGKEKAIQVKQPIPKDGPVFKDKAPPPPPVTPGGTTTAKETDPALVDELTLKAAGLAADGPGLLEFFRQRAKGPASPKRVAELVEQLGSKKAAEREKACAELVAIGAPAVPLLRQAAKDPDDAEVAGLARRCLNALEDNPGALSAAAARLLARRSSGEAVEALLGFLPQAEDEVVFDEVKTALMTVAYRNGKTDAVLLKALEDPSSLRRATAIEVLCQNGHNAPVATLRKLMQDPQPSVRLRTALALSDARDPKAVSTLIALLADLPLAQARLAEDYLIGLAEEQAPKVALGTDDLSRQKCRDAWATWWLDTEGPKLLEEIRKRTPSDTDREKAKELVKKLGDEEFDVRQEATEALKKLGPFVIPLLQQAAKSTDVEVNKRASELLKDMEKETAVAFSPVTARLVALRKPAGAAEVLLNFLPLAEDEAMAAELQNALNVVAFKDGKPEPAVVKALDDKSPVRRGAAAEALAQGPAGDHLDAVRKRLKDADAGVRLKAALALAGGPRERDAVPVLIAAIAEVPSEQSAAAEEYLTRMAGNTAPKELPEGDDARQKRRDAWSAWWTANGTKVALVDRRGPAPVERFHNYTLLIQPNNGQIQELGPDGKVRWQLAGLFNPQDAQVLSDNRILIAEAGRQRVSERNQKGDVLWEKALPFWPMSVQRLPNGNTFIASNMALLEVDRRGNEVWRHNRTNDNLMSAKKMRDGSIVCISNQNAVIRMDASGKEIKRFALQGLWSNQNDILPNGGAVVPMQGQNKVIEYDPDGKHVWEATVMQPMSATRLPNGHTLVTSQQGPPKIIELDRTGKQVAEMQTNNVYTLRARRR
jgi:HEAT repeat protein